jgi:hypothetical protein
MQIFSVLRLMKGLQEHRVASKTTTQIGQYAAYLESLLSANGIQFQKLGEDREAGSDLLYQEKEESIPHESNEETPTLVSVSKGDDLDWV